MTTDEEQSCTHLTEPARDVLDNLAAVKGEKFRDAAVAIINVNRILITTEALAIGMAKHDPNLDPKEMMRPLEGCGADVMDAILRIAGLEDRREEVVRAATTIYKVSIEPHGGRA